MGTPALLKVVYGISGREEEQRVGNWEAAQGTEMIADGTSYYILFKAIPNIHFLEYKVLFHGLSELGLSAALQYMQTRIT